MSWFNWVTRPRWEPTTRKPEADPQWRYRTERDLWFFELVGPHNEVLLRGARGYESRGLVLDAIAECKRAASIAEPLRVGETGV